MSSTKKQVSPQKTVLNRRARFDYELGDELVAGLSLTGLEARAARDGHVQLRGAFVTVRGGELWLNNASFSLRLNQKGQTDTTVDTSPRKLLLTRKQIDDFVAARQKGTTIVPTRLLTAGRFIKVSIALGKGKKNYDKRETLKRRDQEREAARATKRY